MLGIWDADARDDDVDVDAGHDEAKEGHLSVKREHVDGAAEGKGDSIVKHWTRGSGKVWRMQVHQRSAISCLRVDPTRGDTVSWHFR